MKYMWTVKARQNVINNIIKTVPQEIPLDYADINLPYYTNQDLIDKNEKDVTLRFVLEYDYFNFEFIKTVVVHYAKDWTLFKVKLK